MDCFACISVQYPNLTGFLTSQLEQDHLCTEHTCYTSDRRGSENLLFKSIKEYNLILNGFKCYRNVTRVVDFW